jgi:hypothetical protein
MAKLIVCLGYNLKPDNSAHPILENRLKDVAEQCKKNPNSVVLLMGSHPYGVSKKDKVSETSVMKRYLEENFSGDLQGVEVTIEEDTKSVIEQLCYLKKFIEQKKLDYSDIVIISSKFFNDRVKLSAEYIFGTTQGITFIESEIPEENIAGFRRIENFKLRDSTWLAKHEKGNDTEILAAHKKFQDRVILGEIKHSIS